MTTLTLQSDTDTINFISTQFFELIEDSLEIAPPEREDVRFSTHRKWAGRTLRYSTYRTRKITFKARVKDSSDENAAAQVQRISRMLARAGDETNLSGGMYNQSLTTGGATDTGDQGVILKFSLGPTQNVSITSEVTGGTVTDNNIYTARVVGGDITQETGLSHSTRTMRWSDGQTYYFRMLNIELEVDPIFSRTSRIIASVAAPGLSGGNVSPFTSAVNRIFISNVSIPGDAEALTRISTQIDGGQGIIIARDAGISLLNSATSPVYSPATGSTYNDMFCYGNVRSNTGKTYTIKIASTSPDKYQYKIDSGSYSSSITIVANTPQQLGTEGVYVYFYTASGHIVNDTWTFYNNQAYFAASVSYDAYTNRADMYANAGALLKQWKATVPPGCTSKYKVLALVSSTKQTEYTMTADFIGYGGPIGRVTTGSQAYDWVLPPNTGNGYVDLGIIDLSPSASPFTLHPGILTEIGVSLYARAVDSLSSGDTVACTGMYLIPCADEYAYMHAVWTYDGYGHEVYCNYDPNNPYICEVGSNKFDSGSFTNVAGTALNATYAGNVITLIPGVDNTIMLLPIFSAATMDWRAGSAITNSQTTGNTYIAIRPRFLQV